MLRVHTADGLTASFDLENKEQAARWLERLRDSDFQASVTGMTIAHRGVLYSFSKPRRGFHNVSFYAEQVVPDLDKRIKGGERIKFYADGVCVGLMVHREQRAVRVTLTKTGARRFDPHLR